MSVAYGKGAKGKATKLHSIIVRSIGHCEACDYKCSCLDKWKHTTGCKLQAAHLEGRTASGTRTQLRNAFSLCASCHRKFTDKPLTFSRFVTGTWAQQYRDRLLELSRPMSTGQKMDWDEESVRLTAMRDDIKAKRLTIKEARELEHEEN
jgi:hypothetical protein